MNQRKAKGGEELERTLREGTLRAQSATVSGMVDTSEREGHIRFTATGCDNWLDVPVDLIEEWEMEGQQRCRDHIHPTVSLTLREPADEGQRLYFELLSQLLNETPEGPLTTAATMRLRNPGITQLQGGGLTSACLYYSCGTCDDGTVMMCTDIIGCPPNLCTDIVLDPEQPVLGGYRQGHRRRIHGRM